MPTRTAGTALASVIIGALLATAWGAPAEAAKRDDTCFGEVPTIVVPAGESFVGTENDDVILGGYRIDGMGGDDLICDAQIVAGGPGDDRIRILDGGTARGNGGDDEFVSLAVDLDIATGAYLIGGPGKDVFWGGLLGETIYGGSGADVVRSGGGNDVVDLGGGNDEGFGGPGSDRFIAGTGDDFVDGGTEKDTADGGPGVNQCRAVESKTKCKDVR